MLLSGTRITATMKTASPAFGTIGRRTTATLLAWLAPVTNLLSAGTIDLGLSDEFTLSQPTVQVEVSNGSRAFDLAPLNECLLDTGASGILMGKNASIDLKASGLQTVATYTDFGVAGEEQTQVSDAYTFSFAGADGVPISLSNVRLQTSQQDFGVYPGIAGMPLMEGRTVRFDLSQQANLDAPAIAVSFGSGPLPARDHQYSVPLSMTLFPQTGQQNVGDPLPANAPLPFASIGVTAGQHAVNGSFLVDSGAQQCILSSAMAFALGLDTNSNGSLEDETTVFQTVSGVGGSTVIPVLSVDSFALHTASGIDLVQHNVAVGIVDIDPAIAGVLGFNFLNMGWEVYSLNAYLDMLGVPDLTPAPPGVFEQVEFDFREVATTGTGEMRLTLTPQFDLVAVPEPASGWLAAAALSALATPGLVRRARRRRHDPYDLHSEMAADR
jgi:hypothetical protein